MMIKTTKPLTITISRRKLYLTITILIILLLLTLFLTFKYIQRQKRISYLIGGEDAINQIITLADSVGGIIFEKGDNSTLILAKYNKSLETQNSS